MTRETNNFFAAAVLRELRERAGLDQRQLADRAGLDQPDISKRESGKTRIRPSEYARWDEWLGLRPGEFEEKVNAKRRMEDIENRLLNGSSVFPGRDIQVISAVLGELAPVVAELAKLVDGPELDRQIDRLVAYGESMVDAARENLKREGDGKSSR